MDEHDRRIKRIRDAIDQDSTGLTAVLLTAAYAEYYLKKLISTKRPGRANPNAFVAFGRLCQLADALGLLPEGYARFLKEFARLRNKFAHDIDYVLIERDVTNIVEAYLSSISNQPIRRMASNTLASTKGEPLVALELTINSLLSTLDTENARRSDPARAEILMQRHLDEVRYMLKQQGGAPPVTEASLDEIIRNQYAPYDPTGGAER